MIAWFQSLLEAKLVTIFLTRVWNHTFLPNCSVWQSDSLWFLVRMTCLNVFMCPSHFSSLDFGWFWHHIHTSDYNPTGVCWRLMPGPCQERHLSVHHLGVGKPWANGRANPSTHGWNADAKFGQRGKGNWKSCGPSRPGQRNSRNSVRRAVLIIYFPFRQSCTCCDFLSTHKAVTRQSWPTAGSE